MALSGRIRWVGRASYVPLVASVAGLVALWLAEHTLAHAAHRAVLTLACALLAGGLFVAALRLVVAPRPRRRAYALALRCSLTQSWALGLYAVCRSQYLAPLGELAAVAQVLWPAWLLRGLLPAFALEHALASMRHAPVLEMGRLRLADRAGQLLWLACVTFAAVNYAAGTYAGQVDLSALQAAKPSSATEAVVQTLAEPVGIDVFVGPADEVGAQLRAYFVALARPGSALQLRWRDQAVDRAASQALDVRRNGWIVFTGPRRTARLALPATGAQARRQLRRLDGDVLARLLQVSAPARRLYVTVGHEEAALGGAAAAAQPPPQETDLAAFKSQLEGEGYALRRLGLAEGLGRDVPADADVVAIFGPHLAFAPAEVASLRRYLGAGGKLLVALDPASPAAKASLLPLLDDLGVAVGDAPLRHATYQVQLYGSAHDATNLLTTAVSDHPAVDALRRRAGRLALILPQASAVRPKADAVAPAGWRRTPLVWTMPQTQPETAQPPDAAASAKLPLAVAVDRAAPPAPGQVLLAAPQAARAVVVGTAAFVGDAALRNPGNAAFALDVCRWLSGDALLGLAGGGVGQDDPPLLHRRHDDVAWFYGATFAVPAAVLGLALLLNRPARARRRALTPPASAGAPPPR